MVDLSESFWIFLASGGFALAGLCVRYALKSACDKVECCCIKIHRNTEQEIRNDIEQPPSPNNSQQISRGELQSFTL
jgi:hypothetical protein